MRLLRRPWPSIAPAVRANCETSGFVEILDCLRGVAASGLHYRALAMEVEGDMLWFWIGSHAEYDRMIG